MASDESPAERVRQLLRQRGVASEQKPMMGGLCFLANGTMCLGGQKNRLMARLDPSV